MAIRLLLDLQAAQTQSRLRGIGRYSLDLTLALAQHCRDIETHVLLNSSLPANQDLLGALRAGVGSERVHLFAGFEDVAWTSDPPSWKLQSNAAIKNYVINSLQPDIVHVHSIFEGFEENLAAGWKLLNRDIIRTCTLYDVIPYIHSEIYLSDPQVRKWYSESVGHLRSFDHLFAISDATKSEAITYLRLLDAGITVINSGINLSYIKAADRDHFNSTFSLDGEYIVYTGGIDHRKNIENLIRSVGMIKKNIRLLIVCAITAEQKIYYEKVCLSLGLEKWRVVFTGYISDSELRALYRSCSVFVFPSWHEGLGLPVLEAMASGAPVLASRIPSMIELIKADEALFDPFQPEDIARCVNHAVQDESFRDKLKADGRVTVARFTWERTARLFQEKAVALVAERRRSDVPKGVPSPRRPRLAVVTPWPPTKSGIADYSAELLPYLSAYYEITVVINRVDDSVIMSFPFLTEGQFAKSVRQFDRILYMMGGSLFHSGMLDLLRRYPGTVVAHEFYLGGLTGALDVLGYRPRIWERALYHSHGWPAVYARFTEPYEDVVRDWPCSLQIFEHANGIIVHSAHASDLFRRWLGAAADSKLSQVPFLSQRRTRSSRVHARASLGFSEDEIVVVCLGSVASTKMTDQLLDAWEAAFIDRGLKSHLFLVGENHSGEFGSNVTRKIEYLRSIGHMVTCTDYVVRSTYEKYLDAADFAIQLRRNSRGETSGGVLDALASALPTIINSHGSAAEIPVNVALQISDNFSREELAMAIRRMAEDKILRGQFGERAGSYLQSVLNPERIAGLYQQAIERFAIAGPRFQFSQVIKFLVDLHLDGVSRQELECVCNKFEVNEKHKLDATRVALLVLSTDESVSVANLRPWVRSLLERVLQTSVPGWRLEPVVEVDIGYYRTAHSVMYGLMQPQALPADARQMRAEESDTVVLLMDTMQTWEDIIGILNKDI